MNLHSPPFISFETRYDDGKLDAFGCTGLLSPLDSDRLWE
jgi:hypothetical protein